MSQFTPQVNINDSGTDLSTKLGTWEAALLTEHSGSVRPSYVQPGMLWLDTSGATWVWKRYDGVQDIPIVGFNPTSHRLREAVAETELASSSTVNVLGAASKFVVVTGAETITSFGSEPLQIKFVRFTGAATLTHHATNLILPGGVNIVTAAGDCCIVISNASGNARVVSYQKASGLPVTLTPDVPAGFKTICFNPEVPSGWTKDTDINDYAIALTTGTAGATAGNLNFSTVFGKIATDGRTLSVENLPSGNLGFSLAVGVGIANGTGVDRQPTLSEGQTGTGLPSIQRGFSNSTLSLANGAVGGSIALGGSDSPHDHPMDIRVRRLLANKVTKN